MDWQEWHAQYADPDSVLSRRLRTVQKYIDAWLDSRADRLLHALSVCAGQGRDLIGVLRRRPADGARVAATLLDCDPRLVEFARESAASLSGVTIRRADAGDWATYDGLDRADLLLLAGVFGNITEADIARTVAAVPGLCAPDATVIWTLRRQPDRDATGDVRKLFRANGCTEVAFDAPEDVGFSVGVDRFTGPSKSRPTSGRLFTFVR